MFDAHPTVAGVRPPPGLVALLRRRVEATSLDRAAREIGVSRSSLAALLAGLRIRRGTVLLVARALRWPGIDTTPPSAA